MELFILKKIIGALLMPLPLCFLLFILGVIAFYRGRKATAISLSSVSLITLLLLSTPMLPDYLLANIEHQYKQFDLSRKVENIVILGCGHVNDAKLPISAQLYPCSTVRLVEALRIFAKNPDSTIITSGNTLREPYSNAEMNKRLLIALGVDEKNIISVDQSLDTEEESINLRALLKGQHFALVTSASHMPRAMNLFEQQGLMPIAAPTENLVRSSDNSPWWYLLPNSQNLQKSERWWYETLGRTWLAIKSML